LNGQASWPKFAASQLALYEGHHEDRASLLYGINGFRALDRSPCTVRRKDCFARQDEVLRITPVALARDHLDAQMVLQDTVINGGKTGS
jgi:hypothetical protein